MRERFGNANKGVHIPNGTEMEPTAETDELHSLGLTEGTYMLFAGRLVAHKHVHTLIQAFKQSSLNTEYTLVIAGEHSETPEYGDYLLRLAENETAIRFVGNQAGASLQQLFSHAAAYVLPSSSEGLSVSLLEATGMGVPAIVSDLPQNREVVGSRARLVQPGRIADLQAALQDVIHHPSVWKPRARELQKTVKEHYSWNAVVDDLEALYQESVAPSKVTDYSYVA